MTHAHTSQFTRHETALIDHANDLLTENERLRAALTMMVKVADGDNDFPAAAALTEARAALRGAP